jgi:hypothetical protein
VLDTVNLELDGIQVFKDVPGLYGENGLKCLKCAWRVTFRPPQDPYRRAWREPPSSLLAGPWSGHIRLLQKITRCADAHVPPDFSTSADADLAIATPATPTTSNPEYTLTGRATQSSLLHPTQITFRMAPVASDGPEQRVFGLPRRTLGIILLLVVVVLWTTSNFLGSVCAPQTETNMLQTRTVF